MAKQFAGLGATVIDTVADLPSSPTKGLIVFQNDTNELKIYNGSVWRTMLDTDTPPGLVLINSTTYSAAAQVPLDGVFSSAYNNYRIIITDHLQSVNGSAATLTMRAGGVSATSGGYSSRAYQFGTTWALSGQTNTSYILLIGAGGSPNTGSASAIDVFSPFVAKTTNAQAIVSETFAAAATTLDLNVGHMNNTTQYDGFALVALSGTISGTVRVYGYRDSL